MSLLTSIAVVTAEASHPLIAPAWIFPLVAVGTFLMLGAVTWSFRDVAHRHAGKVPPAGPHGH